jgi:hypothetical protein
MNTSLAALAQEKDALLTRSALCRLRLRRDAQQLRNSVRWTQVAGAAAATPTVRRIALGVVLSWIGLGRATRFVMLAGRVLIVARLASSFIAQARGGGRAQHHVRYRTDPDFRKPQPSSHTQETHT